MRYFVIATASSLVQPAVPFYHVTCGVAMIAGGAFFPVNHQRERSVCRIARTMRVQR